ncbi:glutamate 5-kinase [Candidatus Micrarchaeota archaeon]|nr:glutamate 5-kinase [Candidatus Micrarchaeota archaeon]
MRIVIKLGSSLLDGGKNGVNSKLLSSIANQIVSMKEHGFAIVTSGAISTGMKKLKYTEKPKDVATLQALAAVGQSNLIDAYEEAFSDRKILAQVLLTNPDFSDRMRYLNIRNTLNTLLSNKVIPIINENDTVTVMDIKKAAFGDNDTLSAHVAAAIEADVLIILTNTDGLYDKPPSEKGAKLIRKVERVTEREISMCSGTSKLGRGGMLSKVNAAKIATEAGIRVIVCDGEKEDVLISALKEEIGTVFSPVNSLRLNRKKHWIMFASESRGKIYVNEKAMHCTINQDCGISPSDIHKVEGEFKKGDVIDIAGDDGEIICKGITNYFSHEIEKVKGKNVEDIYRILGFAYEDAVSSSDMVLTE